MNSASVKRPKAQSVRHVKAAESSNQNQCFCQCRKTGFECIEYEFLLQWLKAIFQHRKDDDGYKTHASDPQDDAGDVDGAG